MGGGAGNGSWGRTRTKAGARSLVAEQEMDRQRRWDSAQRSRDFRRRALAKIRSMWRRE